MEGGLTSTHGYLVGMQPSSGLASSRFRGTWRTYQRLALDAFDADVAAGDARSYLVLPPGAGKTVVGLEAARRLGRRTLVLVPNTAVQGQWASTWNHAFVDDEGSARAGLDRDLTRPVTVLTYQSIAALDQGERDDAVRDGTMQDLLGLVHPNGLDLLERAAELGPWTVVLDECPHLLATWGALVRAMVDVLGPDTALIGLTATPATALPQWQRELHDDLFGGNDFVIGTPALVKDGNLAPYQELAYLCQPTVEEESWLASERDRFASLALSLIEDEPGSMSLRQWLEARIVHRHDHHNREISWTSFAAAEPDLACSALRFAHAGLIPVPVDAHVHEEHLVEPDAHDWATVLTDFAVHHLLASDDPRDEAALKVIKRALPGLGYRLTAQGINAAMSPVDRLCALSDSKIAATSHLLETEYRSRDRALRALVLCDFETMSPTMPLTLADTPVTLTSGSARRVLAGLVLAESNGDLPVNPLLVTGQTLACGEAHADQVVKYCELRGYRVSALPLEGYPELRLIVGGPGFTSRTWVRIATELFELGGTNVLVGTRALLGEGWDCAKVNVTVDLTTATTPGAITQMRGRSLRPDPVDPDKVANNWTVVCVTSGHPQGDADYQRFVRKHEGYFAPSEDGLIESGVTHCDPTLSPYAPPSPDEAAAATARALARCADHASVRDRWGIGEPYVGVEVAMLRVRSNRSLGSSSPDVPERLAAVVADGLYEAGETNVGASAIRVDVTPSGWIRCELDGVTTEQSQLFVTLLDELLAPVSDQRLFIGRRVLARPAARTRRVTDSARAALGLPLPGAVEWHGVPPWFAQTKGRRDAFTAVWARHIGPAELVSADSLEGRTILERFGGRNPLSVRVQMRTAWR